MYQYRLAMIRQKYRFDGGAECFVSRSIKALENENLELNLITRKWQNKHKKHCYIHICNPYIWGRISRERDFATAVRSFCREKKFDIIQSHERITGCDIYRAGDGVHYRWLIQRSRILAKWKRKMLIHDCYHHYVMNAEKKMYQAPELKAIICNSEMVKKEIIEDFSIDEKKIYIIYNSVDSNQFIPASLTQRAFLRKRLNLPINSIVFCFVGSSFERKGLFAAIEALSVTSAYLIVIGGRGNFSRKRYLSLAKSLGYQNKILFLDAQKYLLPFYQVSDAFILPSLYDPFPNVILEAMACGLPVITSNTCGGSELIEQGSNGFFCDALNINELREAIAEIHSLNKNNSMGIKARNKVKELTDERLSRQLTSLYKSILK